MPSLRWLPAQTIALCFVNECLVVTDRAVVTRAVTFVTLESHGVMEVWSCGVVELWSYGAGAVELWKYGAMEVRSYGVMELWSYEAMES